MPETTQQMQKLLEAVATMTDKMTEMSHQLEELQKKVDETRDIVQAWEAVKVGGKFVKWMGGMATALAAMWLLMKVGLAHIVGSKQ